VNVVEVHDTVTRNTVGFRGELQLGNQMPIRPTEDGDYD